MAGNRQTKKVGTRKAKAVNVDHLGAHRVTLIELGRVQERMDAQHREVMEFLGRTCNANGERYRGDIHTRDALWADTQASHAQFAEQLNRIATFLTDWKAANERFLARKVEGGPRTCAGCTCSHSIVNGFKIGHSVFCLHCLNEIADYMRPPRPWWSRLLWWRTGR